MDDDEDFSTDPNLKVNFAVDTVRFDTVFTTFGSATKRIKVYNRNDKSLVFSTIELAGSGESGFRIKVPPYNGNEVHDVELLKKDSMYLLIEVTIDPQDSNSPMLIRDSIRFVYNGNTQYMQLEAFGQDAYVWRGKTIDKDTTLTGEKPFLIFDSLVINKGVTLNIKENARFFFHKYAGVKAYGSINAKGTIDQPIVFRGDRMDNLFTRVPYDRVPGQWEGVVVDSLSFNNHFEYFHLRNSVRGILFEHSNLSETKATFINSIIHNTTSEGINALNCKIEGYNSEFSNSGGAVMKLIGGDYFFLHCTLASYISSYWGIYNKESALVVGNITDDDQPAPLIRCEFQNSIIMGPNYSEAREQKSENSAIIFERSFKNCLVRASKGSNEGGDIDNIWNEDPAFKYVNDERNTYYYNFQLDSISAAKNVANLNYVGIWTHDMLGVSRIADEGPDMGCYEWTPTAEATEQRLRFKY